MDAVVGRWSTDKFSSFLFVACVRSTQTQCVHLEEEEEGKYQMTLKRNWIASLPKRYLILFFSFYLKFLKKKLNRKI